MSDWKRDGNVYIGERVHTLMWRANLKQRELATLLAVDQGSVSNRLHGKTSWAAIELDAVAHWLGVTITDLLPPQSVGWAVCERGHRIVQVAA